MTRNHVRDIIYTSYLQRSGAWAREFGTIWIDEAAVDRITDEVELNSHSREAFISTSIDGFRREHGLRWGNFPMAGF